MKIILAPGEKASREWREKKNHQKRGRVAKAVYAAADADFAAFMESDVVVQGETASVRAKTLYATYLSWTSILPPMSFKALQIRSRRFFVARSGQGGTTTYMGVGVAVTRGEGAKIQGEGAKIQEEGAKIQEKGCQNSRRGR